MEVRSLAFRTDLMIRRMAGSTIVDRGDHLVVRTPENPDFYWGNFLLLEAAPTGPALGKWIDVFHGEFPHAGHLALGIDGTEFPELPGIPESLGLEVDLGVVLTGSRPPTGRPLADGLTVHPLRTASDWSEELRLRRAESAEDGLLTAAHEEYLRRRTTEASRLVEQGQAVYMGAFDADRLCSVVGIASDGRGVARYQNVATRAGYRRRGLASRLVAEAGAHAVSSMAARLLVIVADHGSQAARLYESLGFTPVEAHLGLSAPSLRVEGPDRGSAVAS